MPCGLLKNHNNGAKSLPTLSMSPDDRLGCSFRMEQSVFRSRIQDSSCVGCATCSAGLADFVIIDGNVLGLEPRDKKIFRFAPDGTVIEEIALAGELDFPVSLDVGPSGFIYVLDRHKDSVLVYSGQGELSYSFLGTGYAPGKVYFARQLRFDPWGRLCIVDEGNGRVEVFSR